MPCYSPLVGYYSKTVNPSGRRSIVFDRRFAFSGVSLPIPCGQCIGCRLERSRQWAVRCMHEKMMHQSSAFLTLTYDNEHVPVIGNRLSLVKKDLQLFMKSLRKTRPLGLRFFACGEYGETTSRPHYHVLLFNTCFPDMKFHKMSGEKKLFASAELDGIWKRGNCLIGEVEFESCAYVARYILKKVTGERSEAHYGCREPEFTCMSRRPGIGFGYYEKFGKVAYKHDNVVVNGMEVGLPRYYDTKYELVDKENLERLKKERRRKALLHKFDNSPERRKVRELFEIKKQRFFKRGTQ